MSRASRPPSAQAGDDLAGILVSAFRHDYGLDQELPDPAFAARARALADANGAALILDDVRAGFRLTLARQLGPDRRAAGSERLEQGDRQRLSARRRHRQRPLPRRGVAALCHRLVLVRRDLDGGGDGDARRAGSREWARAHARRWASACATASPRRRGRHGVGVRQSGPPQMPTILFDDDADFAKGSRFVQEALKRGVYLHPKHNMFLSLAHTAADIDFALEVTDEALRSRCEACNSRWRRRGPGGEPVGAEANETKWSARRGAGPGA